METVWDPTDIIISDSILEPKTAWSSALTLNPIEGVGKFSAGLDSEEWERLT